MALNGKQAYTLAKKYTNDTVIGLGLTKVENSTSNGNIKIDGVETTVYTLPTLTKSSVGLGNVDNTSDASKPVSTATQTALNTKASTTTLTTHTGNADIHVTATDKTVWNAMPKSKYIDQILGINVYKDFVVPLTEVTTGVENTYFYGQIFLKRVNGANDEITIINALCGKRYNQEKAVYNIDASDVFTPIKPCVFTYNSKKYFGIHVNITSSEYEIFRIDARTTTNYNDIKMIFIYDTNAKQVINSEIYNSLDFAAPGTNVNTNFYAVPQFVDSGYVKRKLLYFSPVPATLTSTGTTGDIAYDANYLYMCTATNIWKKLTLGTAHEDNTDIHITPEQSNQITTNKNEIETIKSGKEYIDTTYIIGNLWTDGTMVTYLSRVCTQNYLSYSKNITLSTADGYRMTVCIYDENHALLTRKGGITTCTIYANQIFRFCVYKIVDQELNEQVRTVTSENIGDYEKAVTINTVIENRLVNLEAKFDFLRCFTSFTSIGDSLMAGYTADGTTTITSVDAKTANNNWVSYLCSRLNRTATNLAVGSSTAENWRYVNQEGTTESDISKANIPTSCYFLALGVNDIRQSVAVGTSGDINTSNYEDNANSFYGNYDYLVRKLKSYNAYAKIFVFTVPNSETGTNRDAINTAIKYIANLYSNVYCIDLNTATSFDAGFISNNFKNGHYNPITYNYISLIIEDAINQYIYANYTNFSWIPYNTNSV